MPAVDRITDWIEVLESAQPSDALTLYPTEVVRMLYDLHILRETVMAYEHMNTGARHPDAQPVT